MANYEDLVVNFDISKLIKINLAACLFESLKYVRTINNIYKYDELEIRNMLVKIYEDIPSMEKFDDNKEFLNYVIKSLYPNFDIELEFGGITKIYENETLVSAELFISFAKNAWPFIIRKIIGQDIHYSGYIDNRSVLRILVPKKTIWSIYSTKMEENVAINKFVNELISILKHIGFPVKVVEKNELEIIVII